MKPYRLGMAGLFIFLSGCVNPMTRFQSSAENEREKDLKVLTVGEFTRVSNVGALQVSGVGLVTGLDGTGGSPPRTSEFRKQLEQELRKQKVENVQKILNSKDTALVLVSGMIPTGTRRHEAFDVEIVLPPGSPAISLRGGYLHYTRLSQFVSKSEINQNYNPAGIPLKGHVLAFAQGPLLVGLGNPNDPKERERARIWGGGISLSERPFHLVLKKDEPRASRIANAIVHRLNLTFHDDVRREHYVRMDQMMKELQQKFEEVQFGRDLAKAVSKDTVAVRIPESYRFNPERYLRVARLTPLFGPDSAEQQARYRRRLQKMLVDPTETIRAAYRLEALGKDSAPDLQEGLKNDHPLVRFASAEALAYLGSTAGVEELARLAESHHRLCYYCLLALASLDEPLCRDLLEAKLTTNHAGLRCGAFQALRLLHEHDFRRLEDMDPLQRPTGPLGGEYAGDTFWLHRVGEKSSPLVTFSLVRRAEIILFGNPYLVPGPSPMWIPIGPKFGAKDRPPPQFAVRAEVEGNRVTVSRFTSEGTERRECSRALGEVLIALGELGAQYPDVVDFLKKAYEQEHLNCAVCNLKDKLPPQMPLDDLVQAGRDPGFFQGTPAAKKTERDE